MSIDRFRQFFAMSDLLPIVASVLLAGLCFTPLCGKELAADADQPQAQTGFAERRVPLRPSWPLPKSAKRLVNDENARAWVDPGEGAVLIDGEISLRAGALEMFACTRNTKEHESVVVVDTLAFPIHAALLALGAEPGGPVQYQPEFVPPSGTEIEVRVEWKDDEGELQEVPAQEWVRDAKTQKELKHPWVFAGSLFYTDPESGRRYYQAEGGDFVCVSNFGTAMLDVPIESTQANEGLFFEAFTERIPPLGTPVRLVLKPVLKEDGERESRAVEASTEGR